MFQGVVPKECIAQILRVMDVAKAGTVYNCCSGTFRFEQITLAAHPGAEVHSNDVSLYSSAIAGYVLGRPLDYEFHGALEFVNELDYREPDQRLAALAVGFNLGRFGTGKPNAYKVKHRDHLIGNFDAYVERTLEKVRKLPGLIPIKTYSPRDWIEHVDDAIERGAAVCAFPPFGRTGTRKCSRSCRTTSAGMRRATRSSTRRTSVRSSIAYAKPAFRTASCPTRFTTI